LSGQYPQKKPKKNTDMNSMPRNDQVTRILKVLQILETYPRGLSTREVHSRINEYTEVTERTVRRDLEALLEAGFTFETDAPASANEPKIFKLQNSIKAGKNLVLNPRELLALYLAKGMLSPLKDTAFYQDLESLFSKLDGLIEAKARRYLDDMSGDLKFEPSPKWGLSIDPDTVETIQAACNESHVLSCAYDSGGKGQVKSKRLGPQFLYFAKASLYLVAEDLSSNEVKVYSVPRFTTVEMTDESYEGTPVDPEKFFQSSFGVYQVDQAQNVTVRVHPPVAAFACERRWHPSQQVIHREGGAVDLKLHVGITPELVSWILSLGPSAEAIEPDGLRKEVSKAARGVLEKYDGPGFKKAS
jgi:predicted DNA-binding transcriptional regulator YafY